jgi:hypothetical protein
MYVSKNTRRLVVSTMILVRRSCLESVDHSIYLVGTRTLATILKRLISFQYKYTGYPAADQTSQLPQKHLARTNYLLFRYLRMPSAGNAALGYDHNHIMLRSAEALKIRLEGPVRWEVVEGQAREGVS